MGLLAHAYRTAAGSDTSALLTTTVSPTILASAQPNCLLTPAMAKPFNGPPSEVSNPPSAWSKCSRMAPPSTVCERYNGPLNGIG